MTTQDDVQGWARDLDEVVWRIAPRFVRAEPRRRAAAYLRGLLAPVKRKNGWQLAEAAGDTSPDGVQDFLSRVCWDADAVRDDLQCYIMEHLGDPGAGEHAELWGAEAVGLGCGLTGRGWAGGEAEVASEAGDRAAPWHEHRDRARLHRARRAGRLG